jgi:cardiolipin synthase (CMP-forming)
MQNLRQILYAPNQLTLLRLVFIPPVILFILYGHYGAAFALVTIAGISDGLDGVLARRLGQQTTLGTYLDPIADKLLLSSSFVALGFAGHIPLWLIILVLSRDILILATVLVIILTTQLRTFPPTLYGKANTVAQVGTVLVVLLSLITPLEVLRWLAQIGVYCTAAFTVISGLHYAVRTAARLRGEPTRNGVSTVKTGA